MTYPIIVEPDPTFFVVVVAAIDLNPTTWQPEPAGSFERIVWIFQFLFSFGALP